MLLENKSVVASALVLALLATAFVVEAFPAVPVSAAATSTDCNSQTYPFSIVGATWGTSSTSASAYPGSQDVPLTVTFLFSGPCTSPQTTFYLGLSQPLNPLPFTGPNGQTEPDIIALNISPNSVFTETFDLNVNQSAATGITYYIPLAIDYTDNAVSSLVTQTTTVNGGPLQIPIALYGPVELSFAASTTHLVGGEQNNVTITISNTGTGTSGPIAATVTPPSTVTLLNQLATTPSLAPGASSTQLLELFVPSSLSGTAFLVTFTVPKYLDQYSNAQTFTQTLGFTVASTTTVEASSSFVVQGATWTSASSTTSPLPGSEDTPLVVSLQYLGSTAVTSLQGTLQLPGGFTNLNGGSTATAFSSAATNQYGAVTLTFYVDIGNSAKPGNYNFTLTLQWSTSESLGLTQTAVLTPPPISQLESSFQVQGATWGTPSEQSSSVVTPIPGEQGEPLVVNLQYLGTTTVTAIQGTLTLPAGITDLNGEQTATAYSATASPNAVVTLTFYLNIGSGVKPGDYTYPIQLSWLTSVSIPMSQAATVTPPPVTAQTTAASFPLSVTQENTTVVVGEKLSTGFQLTNVGTEAIYSPTFSLNAGSPVVLSSIGSPVPTTELDPGKSVTFDAVVTASPSATPGIYSGTLSVAFTDSSGDSHTQSFPIGFTVQGTVILILQDTAITQSTTGFTVTGSILNEGTVAAYYSSMSGLVGGSASSAATPVYLGEIDPNTPLPFSVTIPFRAPATITTSTATATTTGSATTVTFSSSPSFTFTRSSGAASAGAGSVSRTFTGSFSVSGFPGAGNVTRGFPGGFGNSTSTGASATIALDLTYKDTFGNNQAMTFNLPTTVKTAGQLTTGVATTLSSGSSTDTELKMVAYATVGAVILVLVAGAFMLRRYRTKRLASLPPDQRGEASVI